MTTIPATPEEKAKAQAIFDAIRPVRDRNGNLLVIPFERWTDGSQREFLKMVRAGAIW